jgi:hypothetical protein
VRVGRLRSSSYRALVAVLWLEKFCAQKMDLKEEVFPPSPKAKGSNFGSAESRVAHVATAFGSWVIQWIYVGFHVVWIYGLSHFRCGIPLSYEICLFTSFPMNFLMILMHVSNHQHSCK